MATLPGRVSINTGYRSIWGPSRVWDTQGQNKQSQQMGQMRPCLIQTVTLEWALCSIGLLSLGKERYKEKAI